MNKEDKIAYLNKIKPFINLKSICEDYNRKNSPSIDYNNLRAVLNGVSKTRLSDDKLAAFIFYLYTDLFVNTFDVQNIDREIREDSIRSIIESYSTSITNDILEELKNGLQNK